MTRTRAVGAVAGLALLTAVTAPLWLAELPFFGIRQVELSGARFLDPEQVLVVLEFDEEESLFSNLSEAELRLEAMPGVVEARVGRKLPATVTVDIVEEIPIALASGPDGFVVLDSRARVLPYDPVGAQIDLPIVARPDDRLVRTLARIRNAHSDLYSRIDAIRFGDDESLVLELPDHVVVLSVDASVVVFQRVAAVQRHLVEKTGRISGELDARYSNWIIVRSAES